MGQERGLEAFLQQHLQVREILGQQHAAPGRLAITPAVGLVREQLVQGGVAPVREGQGAVVVAMPGKAATEVDAEVVRGVRRFSSQFSGLAGPFQFLP